ncbi:MAG: hypothetical protein JJ992_03055 [Planctomycetes bacterium]|nr:hypothetical protein [Planctomycetota bacterium]
MDKVSSAGHVTLRIPDAWPDRAAAFPPQRYQLDAEDRAQGPDNARNRLRILPGIVVCNGHIGVAPTGDCSLPRRLTAFGYDHD